MDHKSKWKKIRSQWHRIHRVHFKDLKKGHGQENFYTDHGDSGEMSKLMAYHPEELIKRPWHVDNTND